MGMLFGIAPYLIRLREYSIKQSTGTAMRDAGLRWRVIQPEQSGTHERSQCSQMHPYSARLHSAQICRSRAKRRFNGFASAVCLNCTTTL